MDSFSCSVNWPVLAFPCLFGGPTECLHAVNTIGMWISRKLSFNHRIARGGCNVRHKQRHRWIFMRILICAGEEILVRYCYASRAVFKGFHLLEVPMQMRARQTFPSILKGCFNLLRMQEHQRREYWCIVVLVQVVLPPSVLHISCVLTSGKLTSPSSQCFPIDLTNFFSNRSLVKY